MFARALQGFCLLTLVACSSSVLDAPNELPTAPPPDVDPLDFALRPVLSAALLAPPPPLPRDPALVALGRDLFFDPILSGNRDVSCATCHDPRTFTTEPRALSPGTRADGRAPTPRNSQSLFNAGLGAIGLLWDGSVVRLNATSIATPLGVPLPPGLESPLAAQAMLPVANRIEMRGVPGDRDVHGAVNELATLGDSAFDAVWAALMKRVLAVPAYAARFRAAFPLVPEAQLGFAHAANALAAFQAEAFRSVNAPIDRYVTGDLTALTAEQKRGAIVFFGVGRCASCHAGAMYGGVRFANIGAPQLGPGTGTLAPLDGGRIARDTLFLFRAPSLRNVELTAPYTHAGAYRTLESVVRHYADPVRGLSTYDPDVELEPALRASYHGDAATIARITASIDPALRPPFTLTTDQQRQLVAFLTALTDPAARDMRHLVPASVPSGLPVVGSARP